MANLFNNLPEQLIQGDLRDIQADTLDIITEFESTLNRVAQILDNIELKNEIQTYLKEINYLRQQAQSLELCMAVVAPMKSGKSTIINSVLGQSILPSRNAAMTTLPTEILEAQELQIPELTIPASIKEIVVNAIQYLSSAHKELEDIQGNYPHLASVIQEFSRIQHDYEQPSTNLVIRSKEAISDHLTLLNDIVRLNQLTKGPEILASLVEIPRLRVAFERTFDRTTNQGKLVLIDTPGPNEAGSLQLTQIVHEQLTRSGVVLVVLDFTNLKTQASEDIRKEVERIAEIRGGTSNLYILVNKVDQRRPGDMSPKEVQDFVQAEFRLSSSDNQVFEISAVWALVAADFLKAVELNELMDKDSAVVRALAREVWPGDFEEELTMLQDEGNLQSELSKRAERYWRKSGVQAFLDQALKALVEDAAPKVLKTALHTCLNHAKSVNNALQLRLGALDKSSVAINAALRGLKEDINQLTVMQKQIQSLENIDNVLEKKIMSRQKTWFKGADQVLDEAFNSQSEDSAILSRIKRIVQRDETQTFDTLKEAKDFVSDIESLLKNKLISEINFAQKDVETSLKQMQDQINQELQHYVQPLITKAQEKLDTTFDISLEIPLFSLPDFVMEGNMVPIDAAKVQIYGSANRAWYKPWTWFRVKPRSEVTEYRISRNDIKEALEEARGQYKKELGAHANFYLSKQVKMPSNRYFRRLHLYLYRYESLLNDEISDQQKSNRSRKQFKEQLTSLVEETQAQLAIITTVLTSLKVISVKK